MAARPLTDGFVEPCIPTLAAKPPSGPDWVHEIKHDGYRLIVRGASPLVHQFCRPASERGDSSWSGDSASPFTASKKTRSSLCWLVG
jgi:hypothetical protein